MQQAILRYGVITIGLPWYESWFHPKANGQLPAPAGRAAGHLIDCDGWDMDRGLLLANSWGRRWGSLGRCYLPFRYVSSQHIWESWKALDQPGV
jgi:C1A family cysteine protease